MRSMPVMVAVRATGSGSLGAGSTRPCELGRRGAAAPSHRQAGARAVASGTAARRTTPPRRPRRRADGREGAALPILTGFGVDASSLDPGTSFRFEDRGRRGSVSHSRLDRVPI
ncbi:hypothetical protein PVAP13_6KG386606 [Panicum virgatum]|uniref:Uncharacterized protein n=1 Tax=Panicum virgatum TaxID=38727 RepID=A0A8T0RF47_PANVG|nr:hypothetical protein PVAP13_6KG386606 [Panicum virgatum]